MTSRERVGLCLRHQRPDRVPIQESFWEATVNRWRTEGLPAEVSAEDYFGLEIKQTSVDNSFGFPHEVIERTDEYIIERNSWGDLTKNWLDHRSTPELLDFSIKTRAQWDKAKKRLAPDPARVDWQGVKAQHARWREQGKFVCIGAVPGYEATWRKIGPEAVLTAIADDPKWVMEMYEYDANMIVGMVKLHLERGFEYDGAWLWDDLAYKNGPLFSPRAYKEQLLPYHRQVVDFCHAQGWPVILHSCGNITSLVPLLIEAGFDCLQALEVKAGVDLGFLVKEYGNHLCFQGGVDVRTFWAEDESEMEQEIRRKLAIGMANPGGYIFHSDHSIPTQVSLQRYARVVELVKRYGVYR
jgi:uroporphyrinogen decarboxylase